MLQRAPWHRQVLFRLRGLPAAGIALLKATDPRRFARLLQDMTAVVVVADLYVAGAAFWPVSRLCALNGAMLLRLPASRRPAHIAILLAHEATHARLARLQTVPWRMPLARRLEQRALREELSFIGRLSPAAYPWVREWARERMARDPRATPDVRAAAERLAAI